MGVRIRKDFIEDNEKLRSIQWPVEFAVMPKTHVLFAGFSVQPGSADLARQRVERLFLKRRFPHPIQPLRSSSTSPVRPTLTANSTNFDRTRSGDLCVAMKPELPIFPSGKEPRSQTRTNRRRRNALPEPLDMPTLSSSIKMAWK